MRRRYGLKYDIEVMYPLSTIAKILSILPLHGKDYKHSGKRAVLYGVCVTCILLVTGTVSMYRLVVTMGHEIVSTVRLTAIASDVSLTIITAVSIIGVNIMYGECFCKFLKNLKRVDKELIKYRRESKYPDYRLYSELVFGHMIFLIYLSYTVFFWIRIAGVAAMQFFIIRDIQFYYMVILTLLLRTYAKVIRYRFDTLNEALMHIGDSAAKDGANDVRELMEVYTHLSDCVKKYNKVFGWQYLTMYIWVGLNILSATNSFIVYGSGDEAYQGLTFSFDLIVYCFIWCVIPLIVLLSLSSACDKGTKAARNTGDICYKYVHTVSKIAANKELLGNLWEFSVQATARCPQFTAGGFFSINYGAIFTIGGVVTTYIVVLIQIHK